MGNHLWVYEVPGKEKRRVVYSCVMLRIQQMNRVYINRVQDRNYRGKVENAKPAEKVRLRVQIIVDFYIQRWYDKATEYQCFC